MEQNTDSIRNGAPQPGGGRGKFPGVGKLSSEKLFSGPLGRCAAIGVITLFLLVPLELVSNVIFDRSHLYHQATDEIRASWGRDQTISGPVLILPYVTWQDHKEVMAVGKEKEEVITRKYTQEYWVVLPSNLSFDAKIGHEVRYRGIYKQALYTAPVTIDGSFTLPAASDFPANLHMVKWDKAWITVGISDPKAIAEAEALTWGGKQLGPYRSGSQASALIGHGFHTLVPLRADDAGTRHDFATHLTFRGSNGIAFTPVGENTRITVSADWPSPKFQGNLLPVTREIRDTGFSATWMVSSLTRSYPQSADVSAYLTSASLGGNSSQGALGRFAVGVELYETVSTYRLVIRAVDYGILFILVSFVALFAFEMITRRRMHLLQYGMVGLSMSTFYLVLLSLSEHAGFGAAFLAASAITVLMNSVYVASALGSRAKGLIMAGVLSALYGVLFAILRMEDMALLTGTALVLVMMGVLMYVTRKLPQT